MMDEKNTKRSALFDYGMLLPGLVVFTFTAFLTTRSGTLPVFGLSYMIGYCYELHLGELLNNISTQTFYPPLYMLWMQAVCFINGLEPSDVLLGLSVPIPLAALYLTAISRRLDLGSYCFLPGLLLLLFAGTFAASRNMSHELLFILFVPAFAYHLLASQTFERTGHAILCGAWAGLAMLNKWTFPIYIVGILLVVPYTLLFQSGKWTPRLPKMRMWIGVFAGVVTASVICGWWYLFQLNHQQIFATASGEPSVLDYTYAKMLWTYFKTVRMEMAFPVWTPILFATIFGIIFSKKPLHVFAVLFVGVLAPLLFYSRIIHLETRYIFPLLPAIALAMGMIAARARWKTARLLIALLLVGATTYNHFHHMDYKDRKRLEGIQTATNLFVRYAEVRYGDENSPVRMVTHPFWKNEHLNCTFLNNARIQENASENIQTPCPEGSPYRKFSKELRLGEYDIVLMDCGGEDNCRQVWGEMIDWQIKAMEQYGAVSKPGEEFSQNFTWKELLDDTHYIRNNYRMKLYLPLDDGSHTRLWVRKDWD